MTANAQAQPKWKIWLRRAVKPRPFWQQRFHDRFIRPMLDGLGIGASVIANVYVLLVTGAIIISGFASFIVAPVFLSPGFFQNGAADFIGRAMAAVCLSTGNCNLPALLGGTAIGLMMVVLMMLAGLMAIHTAWQETDDEDGEVSEDELFDALSIVDDRIVRLRADLVLAGVLPLSEEEKAELDEVLTQAEPAPVLMVETPAAPAPYVRPEPSKDAQLEAGKMAVQLTANKSTAQIRAALAVVLCENQRLALEVNEHRAARGIEPLPTFDGGK